MVFSCAPVAAEACPRRPAVNSYPGTMPESRNAHPGGICGHAARPGGKSTAHAATLHCDRAKAQHAKGDSVAGLARTSYTHTCRIDGKRPILGARARGSWA